MVYIRYASSYKDLRTQDILKSNDVASYPKNSRIVGNLWGQPGFFGRSCLHPEILHVATTKNDVFIDIIRRGNFFVGILFATFCPVGLDVLEGNGGVFRVDVVKHADVSDKEMSNQSKSDARLEADLMSLLEIRDIRDL